MTSKSKYEKRGVSASKSDIHHAIRHLDKGLFPMAFCKVLPDLVGHDPDYCNIMHADTAGTKTSLAYLYWKETGDLSVWKGIVQDAIVMNIDDMACVGCVDDIVLSSTIGRNKKLIPGAVIEHLIQGISQFLAKLEAFGIGVHLAGGETADVGDIVRTLDVGFTTFARMKRENVVVNDIRAGDVIVGLASYGKTTYEENYNGGMGSNGFTSARHDMLEKYYSIVYPESFDPSLDSSVVYKGTKRLWDETEIDGKNISIGKLMLSPTRTYLPVLKDVLAQHRKSISGIIHCTGGGQTKVLNFIKNKHVVKSNLFTVPPLFQLIHDISHTDWKEMYQVFNMGHRMEIYTNELVAKEIIDLCRSFDLEAQIVGHVGEAVGEQVTIESKKGTFQYS